MGILQFSPPDTQQPSRPDVPGLLDRWARETREAWRRADVAARVRAKYAEPVQADDPLRRVELVEALEVLVERHGLGAVQKALGALEGGR